MAAGVNAVNYCFNIGSIVLCTTSFNEEVEGEMLAFDHDTKMLILKCRSKVSEYRSDVTVLNLSLCSNVQVVKESNDNMIEELQKLYLEQVDTNTTEDSSMSSSSMSSSSLSSSGVYSSSMSSLSSNNSSSDSPVPSN